MARHILCVFAAAAFCVAQQTAEKTELEKAVEEFRIQSRDMGLRADSPARRQARKRNVSWHGRLFHNLRNDFFDAVPHEVTQRGGTKGLLRRNQFGFNAAGPVLIPKLYDGSSRTFFTVTFEGMREKIARSFLRTIPTLGERSGDWAHVVDSAGVQLPIYDPASTAPNPSYNPAQSVSASNLQYLRSPFTGNRIPSSRLDPVAQQALEFYPAPNTNAGPFFQNNYFIFAPEINRADGLIGKVDHQLKDAHRLSVGLNWSDGVDGAAPWFPSAANPGTVPRERSSRRAGVDHVWTVSAATINTLQVEASSSRTENQTQTGADGAVFPNYQFAPYLSMGRPNAISRSVLNAYEVSDSFATRKRGHRVRVSGQFNRYQYNSLWPQYPSGRFRFTSGLTSLPGVVNTGHAFASFLLGGADYVEQSVVLSPSYFRRSRFFLAFRDQWEPLKGLTLSFGLNIEAATPRVERYDRQSTIDLEEINPANGRPGALVAAMTDGQGRAFQPVLVKPEPSASLSWNVLGNSRTLLRASYARSYSLLPVYFGQWGTQAFNGTPTAVSPNPQLAPALWLQDGLAFDRQFPDLRPDAANNTVADLIEPTGRQPTVQSASLSVEREFQGQLVVSLGASHSGGRNLLLGNGGSNPNAIPLDALQFRDLLNDEAFNRSVRPYPQYQRFDVNNSWPEGRYQRDAGFLRVEKRAAGGLTLSATYEVSKQMDNYSGPYGVQDYFNRRNEWSLTAGNNPQRLSLSYSYDLPLGPNRAFLQLTDWRRVLVAGWSISGQTTMVSGEPLALRPQFNNTGRVVDSLRVNVVPGADPTVENPGPDLWFNPAAFSHPADFTIGDGPRTHPSLRQPGSQNHDLALNKRFPLTSESSLELSAVGLNFVNHANWEDPDTQIGTAASPNVNAGRIIGSRGGRIIQVGLRYNF